MIPWVSLGSPAGSAWGCSCPAPELTRLEGPRGSQSHVWLAVGQGNQLRCLRSFHVSLFSHSKLGWISYVAAPTQRSKEARHNAQMPLKFLLAMCLLTSHGPKTVTCMANSRVNVEANIQAYGYVQSWCTECRCWKNPQQIVLPVRLIQEVLQCYSLKEP